jgi:putative hydrolase of the HAD superfamily
MEPSGLIELIRAASVPMESVPPPPLPTEWEGLRYPGKGGEVPASVFRAVLFDVYGTLFCSAAGEINEEGRPGSDGHRDALAGEYAPGLGGADLGAYFKNAIVERHRAAGVEFPEVRVEEIWDGFLRKYGKKDNANSGASLSGKFADTASAVAVSPTDAASPAAMELALRYELAVNPVYPMPGALEIIVKLADGGITLGIVSNAQFFTPLLFEAFFGAPPEKLGFTPELLIYSYKMGEAKPSPRLFGRAAERLGSVGITPERCLCIGNDMRNDVSCALDAGFRAALFAGDGRSLRLREETGKRPSYIVSRLGDLPGLCGLNS